MELFKGVIQNGFALRKKKKLKIVVEITDMKDKSEQFLFPMRPDSYFSYIAKLVKKKICRGLVYTFFGIFMQLGCVKMMYQIIYQPSA